MSEALETVSAPPGGRLKKILLIVLPALLVAGGAAWWVFAPASTEARTEESTPEDLGVLPMDTFLVNLIDPGGNRFLKTTIHLVFESPADAAHVGETAALKSHARSAILELLTQQSADVLVTVQGKQQLKDAIRNVVNQAVRKPKVVDVLFAEFVVQF